MAFVNADALCAGESAHGLARIKPEFFLWERTPVAFVSDELLQHFAGQDAPVA